MDNTNVLILNSENYKLFYDKCYIIASCLKPNMTKFHQIESLLMGIGFYRRDMGKNKPLFKAEPYTDIFFSYNTKEKTYKFTFQFKTGFNPLKIENYVRNWLVNQIRDNMENWEIYQNLELTGDFNESEEVPILQTLLDIDKSINSIYDIERKFIKKVYVNGHFVKLYSKNGKVRLEVTGSKQATHPFEVFNEIVKNKRNLAQTEFRNELYFEDISKHLEQDRENVKTIQEDQITLIYQIDQIKKELDSRYNQIERQLITSNQKTENQIQDSNSKVETYQLELMKVMGILSQNQDKIIETQNMFLKNMELLQSLISDKFETIYNQNKETQEKVIAESSLIRLKMESGLKYRITHFFRRIFHIQSGSS